MEPPIAEWRSFLESVHPPGLRPPILASWKRCAEAGIDGERADAGFRRVSDEELSHRLRANEPLLTVAAPHLQWISALLADVPHAVYLVDADGIVLRSVGTWSNMEALGLLPGFDWSEVTMGTNGAGTALVTNQPVAVVGPEHFSRPFHGCTCTAAPIHDPDGHVIGAIDISTPADHTGPERLLLAAHSALVIDQALYASAQVEQAESLRLLALLSSFTAHELVNPLSALKTVLDLLARTPLRGEPAKMISAACGSAERLLQVVEELRILGGSHDRRLQRTDLPSLVHAVSKRITGAAHVQVDVALSPGSRHVDCNPALFGRALYNLLDNARHAAGEAGSIGVRLEDAPAGVRVVVWDNGPGVRPDAQHHLFRDSFTTKPGGSGLGLLLTRVIVEQVHGGHLRYRQNQPHGARFEMELPLKQVAARSPDLADFCS